MEYFIDQGADVETGYPLAGGALLENPDCLGCVQTTQRTASRAFKIR